MRPSGVRVELREADVRVAGEEDTVLTDRCATTTAWKASRGQIAGVNFCDSGRHVSCGEDSDLKAFARRHTRGGCTVMTEWGVFVCTVKECQ